MDPVLLLIGAGGQPYREYLLASIGTRYRVHLFTAAEPTWERSHLAGWTVLDSMVDTIDAAQMSAAAAELAARQPVQGVLSWDEARILQAAKVAAALGLPGGDPDMVMRCRDKHQTRRALAAAGVPQPRSALVADLDAALTAAAQIGYPVVLKPRAMGASLGVVRADCAEHVRARFAFAHDTAVPGSWRYDEGVLVERYLDGPEISIDAAVREGQVHPLFVARKHVGYPPYFEEIGHVVDGSDLLLTDLGLLEALQAAHTALGFSAGMTHTEFKLGDGAPQVIEVNARLGGDLIPYLGMRSRGIDPALAAAAIACGREPELAPRRSLVAAVRFFYPADDDTAIGAVRFDRARLPDAIDKAIPLVEPGEIVSPPPKGTLSGRVAAATAVASTEGECRTALDAAQAALVIVPQEVRKE